MTLQFETGACAVAVFALEALNVFEELEASCWLVVSFEGDVDAFVVVAGCDVAISASVLLVCVSAAKSVKKSYCLDILEPQLLRKTILAQGSLTGLIDRTRIVASKLLAVGVTSRRTRPASNLLSA